MWKYAASFYPAKIVKTAELDPDGNYIFCAHPHGIFCSSLFLAFATEALDFSKLYPGTNSQLELACFSKQDQPAQHLLLLTVPGICH